MGNGIPSTITPISAMQQSWDATYIDGSVESVWWDAGKGQYGVDYSPSDSSVDSMNLPDDIGIIAVASILHLTNNLSDPILPSTSSGNYTPVTIVPTGGFSPNSGGDYNGNSLNYFMRKPTGQCATIYDGYVSASDKINGDAWLDGWGPTIAGCITGPSGCAASIGISAGWSAVHPGTERQQLNTLYNKANANWQVAGCGSNMHNPFE
jgi:hypothetical protein